ncbi:MAG TPA: hypothetical protein VF823_00505 [Anaerolineales bacterium]
MAYPIPVYDTEACVAPQNRNKTLFLISVLGLFLEMLLIRWIGTEIRIFAYVQNVILVACFLGLGLGCFTCRKQIVFRHALIPLALFLLLMAIPVSKMALSSTTELLSVMGDLVIWAPVVAQKPGLVVLFVLLGLALTYSIIILVVDMFVPLGRLLGRLMDDHPDTIWAYSINIAGSLVGTWLFVLLSMIYQPPFTWFLVLGLVFLVFIFWTQRDRKMNLVLLAAIIICSWFVGQNPNAREVIWSPYQKLEVYSLGSQAQSNGNYMISVNSTGYQAMLDLSQQTTASNPSYFPPEMQGLSQYDIPLLLHPNPKSFLIVGAGSGNDAAGALRHGVRDITAVEIDPAIISIGDALHPEKPYSSPNVQVVNDDARSFFATTTKKYDVIAFGLLDSHTTTAMTNARLDHYVYTRESIERAKTLLAPGGVIVLTFEAQKTFIADRMASVLKEVFGQEPIAFRIPSGPYGWGGVMFITGDQQTAQQQIARNQRLSDLIAGWQKQYPLSITHTTRVVTDDWPYIYLESPSIPLLYILIAGLMVLVLVRSAKKWQAGDLMRRWRLSHWHFFFLGAAFLLLEVQNISKASVVLGNTWSVNAVIVSGVLMMALLANFIARKFPNLPLRWAYAGLITICLALYFVDLAQFAFLPYLMKALVVGSLTTLPMLFSGVIFVRSFAGVDGKDEALGANLVGSLAGALLQSITFIVGIKALLLVVASLYLLSLFTLPVKENAARLASRETGPETGS